MRSQDRKLTDRRAIEELLSRAQVGRLGLADPASPAPLPYVVPVHFAYRAGRLYVHCAPAGMKLEILQRNDRVCLEVDELLGVRPARTACGYSTAYRSLIAFGRARLLDSPAEKRDALEALVEKYASRRLPVDEAALATVAVLSIQVQRITAKAAPETG